MVADLPNAKTARDAWCTVLAGVAGVQLVVNGWKDASTIKGQSPVIHVTKLGTRRPLETPKGGKNSHHFLMATTILVRRDHTNADDELDDVEKEIADAIEDDRVTGWFLGRYEDAFSGTDEVNVNGNPYLIETIPVLLTYKG